MKFISSLKIAVLSLGAVAVVSAADAPAAAPVAPAAATATAKFTEPQLLETLGWFIGRRTGLSELGFSSEQVADIIKGIQESAAGKDSPYKIDDIGPELDQFMQAKQAAYTAKQQSKSKADSDAFFANLKKTHKDLVVLPDGLCYEISDKGTGVAPTPTDTVKVNYTGTLVDGKKFDASADHGGPAEFQLNGVIPGWTEGLQKIAKGGKIKLYVPSALAYGDEGHPPVIPAGATLVFDIELLDIKATPPADAQQAAPSAAPAEAGAGM